MEKIIINGQEYVKVDTVRQAIADLRKTIPIRYNHNNTDEKCMVHSAYTDVALALIQEKLEVATTIEEHKAALEIQGSFIVCRKSPDNSAKLDFFNGWEKKSDHKPFITDHYKCATVFNYRSMAEEICDWLNWSDDEWEVMDMQMRNSKAAQVQLVKMFGVKNEGSADED